MFIAPSDAPIPIIDPVVDSILINSSLPTGITIPVKEGHQGLLNPSSSPHTASFWIWFYLTILCSLLCLGLNFIFSVVSVIERHRTFRNSFHAIVLVFSISVVVSSTCKLIYIFVAGLAGVQSEGFNCFSITVDLAISYFSALLIFFLGLNRFAAFSSPYLYDRIMGREILHYTLLGLLLFSVIVTVVIFKIGGLQRKFTQNAMVDYAKNRILVQVPNYMFYTLPMISSVFYLFAYRSLRSKRGNVISGVTKSLLDKAEKCNLKTGIWILVIYLISLIIHVAMQFPSVDVTSLIVLSSMGTIASAAPQFVIPLAVLCCSKEAREVTSGICWLAVKSGLSSILSKRRISSASSTTAIVTLTLHSETARN